MAQFCPKCGAKLREGAGFCVKCGYRLEKSGEKATASKEETKKSQKTSKNEKKAADVVTEEAVIKSAQKENKIEKKIENENLSVESVPEDIKNTHIEESVDHERASSDKKSHDDNERIEAQVFGTEKQEDKKGSKSVTIIGAIAALLLIVGGFCYFTIMRPKMNYDKAINLANENRYTEAVTILEKLGDYKDSKELLAKYIEKTYLSKNQADDLAAERFDEFINEFNTHFNQNLHAYLPKCLASREVSKHEYEYYYLYFYGNDNDKTSLKGVTRIVVVAEPKGKYEIKVDDYVNYAVNLKNVHKSEMHIRDYPDEKWGNKSGKVAVGSSVQIYAVYYVNHATDEYIWYCISSNGYTKWIADGINKSSEYYVFDNGTSTKDIVFIR